MLKELEIYMLVYVHYQVIMKKLDHLQYFRLKQLEEMENHKEKQRFVVLHNNLDLSHFIKNKESYLINWDKSNIDIPIFDLYKLYKRHALDFNFENLLKTYEKNSRY